MAVNVATRKLVPLVGGALFGALAMVALVAFAVGGGDEQIQPPAGPGCSPSNLYACVGTPIDSCGAVYGASCDSWIGVAMNAAESAYSHVQRSAPAPTPAPTPAPPTCFDYLENVVAANTC